METPKDYKLNLKNGILTTSMIEDALYSLNKRAKNCRDMAKHYQNRYAEKYAEQKELYYDKKSDILQHCQNHLTAIHSIDYPTRMRFDENDIEYDDYIRDIKLFSLGEQSKVIHTGCYFNRDLREYINFADVIETCTEYYLYYEFPKYSFHSPIDKEIIPQYKGIPTIKLDELTTYGKDISRLVSCQFCDKVHQLIMSGAKIEE